MQTAAASSPSKLAAIFRAVRRHFAVDHDEVARAFTEGYEAGPRAVNPYRRWSAAYCRWELGNKSGSGN